VLTLPGRANGSTRQAGDDRRCKERARVYAGIRDENVGVGPGTALVRSGQFRPLETFGVSIIKVQFAGVAVSAARRGVLAGAA